MPLTENKHIEIYGYNVVAANNNGVFKLTEFVNKLVDDYFNGRLVQIEDENKNYLDEVGAGCGKTINEIVNSVLRKVEPVIPKAERLKVEIDEPAVKVKHRRSIKITD